MLTGEGTLAAAAMLLLVSCHQVRLLSMFVQFSLMPGFSTHSASLPQDVTLRCLRYGAIIVRHIQSMFSCVGC